MRAEGHQPFRFQLTERLAYGNAAHAKLFGQRILTERLAFGIVAPENALAQCRDRHARDRLTLNRCRARSGRGRWRCIGIQECRASVSDGAWSSDDGTVVAPLGYSICGLRPWQAFQRPRRDIRSQM